MEEIQRELSERARIRLEELMAQKLSGKPLVVCNSTFLPVELIRAAGANVYPLCRGGDPGPIEAAVDYTLDCIHPMARACVGYVIGGLDEYIRASDLLVMAFADDHMGRMIELLEYEGFPVCKVGIPVGWQQEIAHRYYENALKKMMDRVESLTGSPADPALARTYFARSNRIAQALRQINALRMGDEVPIGIEDLIRLHQISFFFRTEEDTAWLERTAGRLAGAQARFDRKAPRLLLAGRVVAFSDHKILRMLDESGCPVVAEMLDEGLRVLEEDVSLEGGLLENFARARFPRRPPLSTFQPSWKLRFAHLRRLLEEYRVDGVVWYQLAHDEIYDMEYTCLEKWLGALGVPLVRFETDFYYTAEKTADWRAKLKTFLKAAQKHKDL